MRAHLIIGGGGGPPDYLTMLNRKPDKEIVVMVCEKIYEKELSFPTILMLPDKYVMYYIAIDEVFDERSFYTCYAESIDGINWSKPSLGLIEYRDSKENNIISKDFEGISVEYHNGIFYLLAYSLDYYTYLYKSIDGIRFEKISGFSIPYCADTQNQIIWDMNTNKYKLYLRSWYESENRNVVHNHTDSLYRAVSLAETNNIENYELALSETPFYRWGKGIIPPAISNELPVVIKNTDDMDYDIYNSAVHIYGNLYIAYPILYYHYPEPPQGGKYYNDGYAVIGMYVSNDGINFIQITNDYDHGNDYKWCESAIGHIETKEKIIQYFVKFNKMHGDPRLDSDNKIIARIYLK
jgi:hypothetical protein